MSQHVGQVVGARGVEVAAVGVEVAKGGCEGSQEGVVVSAPYK